MQQKYNKFLKDLNEELNHPLRQQILIQPQTMSEISSMLSRSGMGSNQGPGGQPDFNMEEYFEGNLENFSHNIIQIKEIFKQAMNVDVNYEFRISVDNTLVNLKDLIDQITQYFTVFRGRFSNKLQEKRKKALIEKEEDQSETNRENGILDSDKYNERLEYIHEGLDELNQINIERLGEIRDLNNKLEVLDEHLNSLMKDITDKRKKLLKMDSNVIDVNSLIRSYENNLKEKNKLLNQKQDEYKVLKEKSELLNERIREMFYQIIELDKRTEALKQPVKEGRTRQENVETAMKDRENHFESLEKEKAEMERDTQHLEELTKNLEEKIKTSEKELKSQKIELNSKSAKNEKQKEELRKIIREQVRKVKFNKKLKSQLGQISFSVIRERKSVLT